MSRPLFLLGLGGFGKWVVTGFKKEILDIYGYKPNDVDWLAIDLIGNETPTPQYPRFESGKFKQEMLDFSGNSEEFLHFSGNFQHEMDKIKVGDEDSRVRGRMTKADVELIIKALEQGIPAAERRHLSMLQFMLDIDNIKKALSNKVKENSMTFVVNSWAGGTGAGIFLDCLLLLRKLMVQHSGNLYTINLLPQGFEKVKENEDITPLYGNSYATFREFLRLYSPKGNTKVQYSLHDMDFQDISKPRGVDVISDLSFIVDGSSIGGQKGSNIHYKSGIVPSIVTFITNSFLAVPHEERQIEKGEAGTRNETAFDQGKTRATANFLTEKAKNNPYNAFSFSALGSYRLIFDSKAIKTELAQKIASDIFSHKYFQAPSWIPDSEFYVKEYMTNTSECTKFEKELVHECITKGHQIANFASFNSLKNRLEEGVKFPEFNVKNIKLKDKGKVKDTKGLVDHRVRNIKGGEENRYDPQLDNTFYAVYNYYYDYYTNNFAECVQKKVSEILNNGKGGDTYGKGNLKAAESFVKTLKVWYIKFIRGFPEKNEKAIFNITCSVTDQMEGTYADWQERVDEYYRANEKKGKALIGGDPNVEYLKLRDKLNELELRDLKRELIRNIAEKNLAYLEELEQKILNWLETFKECFETLQEVKDNLLEVRSAKKSIVTDEYLTDSEDEIEERLYRLVTDSNAWDRINDNTIELDPLDNRFKEVLHKVPKNNWADYLKGFTWKFNKPDETGKLPSEKHAPGDLVCFVDSGMPDFPSYSTPNKDEAIKTWNYNLVEYYLTHHRLKELDKMSAFEVLTLRGDDPSNTLDDLRSKSGVMLSYNETKEKDLSGHGYNTFPPENHFSIVADFGYTPNQPYLKTFIDTFGSGMSKFTKKENITVADERNKPHEIVFLSSRFSLPAPAIQNLFGTRPEYLRRMEKNLPPPLHIFKGEKEAYKYETQISKTFRTNYEELHPQVVSILESEMVVHDTKFSFINSFLWAIILEVIKKEDNPITGQKSYYIELEEKEYLYSGSDWPFYCDMIYDLIYSSREEDDFGIKRIIEDLKTILDNTLLDDRSNNFAEIKTAKAEEYTNFIKKEKLPKREEDLYKVWIMILNNR